MGLYKVTDFYISSDIAPKSFAPFATDEKPDSDVVTVKITDLKPEPQKAVKPATNEHFKVYRHNDSWLYIPHFADVRMTVSADYLNAELYINEDNEEALKLLFRLIIECRMILRGNVSLHSACVFKDGYAVNFSGVSGVGKSTRAAQWVNTLGFNILSGDRPAMLTKEPRACGVPWDGKEKIYRSESYPVRLIFDVRRAPFVRLRKETGEQAYKFLIQQIFVPLWDSELSMYAFINLRRLIRNVPVYRLMGGPDEASAREAFNIAFNEKDKIFTEDKDMKLKDDFIVRNMLGEYMAIPTGDNVAKFDGSVILNDVSAFIIEQLKKPINKEDLLELVLSEYDVTREQASADLDSLLEKLDGYGMLEK